MDVLYSEDNKIIYKWINEQKADGRTDFSDTFHMKNLNFCGFKIAACLAHFSLDIEVRKDYPDAAKAIIKICVNEKKQSIKVNDWISACKFTDIYQVGYSAPHVYHRLNITCTIKWEGFVNNIDLQSVSSLYQSIKGYAMMQNYSDVVIAIDDQELPGHKIILAAQSPVFARMLEADMKEAHENRIVIDDVEIDVMRKALEVVYGGQLSKNEDPVVVLKLLAVAEKYGLDTLKTLCEFSLSNSLTLVNVMNIFKQANMYNAAKLRLQARKFMVDNRKELILQNDFKEMYDTPELLYEFVTGSIQQE